MFSRVMAVSSVFHRQVVRPGAWVVAGLMGVTLLQATTTPASAAPKDGNRPAVTDPTRVVPARPALPVEPRKPNAAVAAAATKPAPVVWPAPGSAELAVPRPDAGRSTAAASSDAVTTGKAGGLTVAVSAPSTPTSTDTGNRSAVAASTPGTVKVEMLDRKASQTAAVDGPVVRVGRTDGQPSAGQLRLSLGYEGVAGMFGGDFGARLRLVQLPECALTTPHAAGCLAQPLPTVNNGEGRTLSADVAATSTGALYAMVAADASSQGNYGATKLAPSAKWSVSPSTGGYSWSYPLTTPPVPSGGGPGISLAYSSQSVDGRTATTNNQGSWIGEGFSYEPGYIERRYKPCAEDGHELSGDLCWAYENATVMLNGKSTELVKEGNTWRLGSDDGSKVEWLTGATNGDDNGEHWRITTVDGTEHTFGLNRLPGWSSNKEETDSAWTVPVFGDDDNEPCEKETFAESHCKQAWRWSLDYVKDRHGNVSSYFYERESNHYARGARADLDGVEYHRAGWLKRVDYGQRDGQVYNTNAPARVRFDTAERCLPTTGVDCDPQDLNNSTASHWPDVPWDRNCAANTKCKIDQVAPSFWTRKRLTTITTEIRGASGWSPVDRWKLDHLLTDNGDGSRTLWLHKITHTGLVNGSAATPPVELAGLQMPNRIDRPDDFIAPLIRFRLTTIYTETAGQIDISYKDRDCAAGNTPTEGNSTRRCFPVKWKPLGSGPKVTDWFHKYVVHQVTETDRTNNSPDSVTRYDYLDGAAWRHAEKDGISDDEYLTWSDWRGYGRVQVTGGDGQTMTTKTEYRYLRGLHGDKDPDGGTRTVTVTDSAGTVHTDHEEFSSFEYESKTFDGATETSKTLSTPWRHTTATETHSWGTKKAYFVNTASTRSLTSTGANAWRETKTSSVFETSFGRTTQVEDEGDVSKTGDEDCTRTTYADSSSAYLYSLVSRVETVAVKCSATPNRKTQVLTDSRTWYDGKAFGVAPTRGNPTRTEQLASHDGTTPTYVRAAEATFDTFGRALTTTDAAGSVAKTAYTETNGLTTKVVQTNPLGHETVTEFAPARGSPISQVDPNDFKTLSEYDPLGRLTKVWLPDTSRVPGLEPSIKYTYLVPANKATAVKTETQQNDLSYKAEYQLFDGWLRPRQIQAPGPDGTRLVSDTFYTPTGETAKTYATYQAAGVPSDEVLPVDNGDVDGQTLYVYDGADRVRETIFAVAGVEKWRTSTTYGGDWTSVDPPEGGTPRTTITNALGQTTELRQYKGDSPTGDFEKTEYTYTPAGQLKTVKDPAGNLWGYEYDQRGRKVRSVDPDAGTTTFAYDDLGQMVSSTNALNATISYTYDPIGRKKATYKGSAGSGQLLSQWEYDEELVGTLFAAKRYVDGAAYTTYSTGYDEFYRPHATLYEVPEQAGAELAGIYTFGAEYNRDGTVQVMGMSDGGGLPFESVAYTYDGVQRPVAMTGDAPYLTAVDYTGTGEVLQSEAVLGTNRVWSTYEREQGSKRLTRQRLDRSGAPVVDIDARYRYDPAGNVTSIVDTPTGNRDAQCFTYDHLRRLTEAWTSASTAAEPCVGGPQTTGVGGIAPYHHSYTFDAGGNRKTETQHPAGGSTLVERTYEYPQPGQPQPHTLSRMTETTSVGDRLHSYEYDDAGNTTRRTEVADNQTLAWDAEGNLASVTEAGVTTSFVYDVDGSRMLRKEPGTTTLYLPGTELRLDHTTRVVNGTRYYPLPGGGTIVRKVNGLSYIAADHNGTGQASVDQAGGVVHRRSTPFGGPRGTQPGLGEWPSEKGFVNGNQDSTTGLVNIGAREYDPVIGRFISVDPVMDLTDPQQMQGYAYANNNPVSFSDPTGLRPECGGGTGTYSCVNPNGSVSSNVELTGEQKKRYDNHLDDIRKRNKCQESWYCRNKSKIAGAVAGTVVGVGCGLAIGWTGVGAVGCGALAGAVGAAVTGWMDGQRGWDLAKTTIIGGAVGAVTAGVFSAAGAGVRGAVGAGAGSRASGFASGFGKEARNIVGRGCKHSFDPETPVVMADGTTKPIKDVEVGDKVLATDPATGETVPKEVVGTHKNLDKELAEVKVLDPKTGVTAILSTTQNHPFWNDSAKVWNEAKDLGSEDRLATVGPRAPPEVLSVKVWDGAAEMRDLTVADIHTYFVVAGEMPVLVHNCGESFIASAKGDRLYGPYHRLESPTQKPEVADQMVKSGELWGRVSRVSFQDRPMVQAYRGALPDGKRGVEFYTPIKPLSPRNSPPGEARWVAGMPGVREEGDFAKIPIFITRNTQR
ncbi:RHS repeat-associated core domain-containing protein [Micromonospora sp. NPDC050397]|uniref:RHS repeat-associated core domain-containing protein n=1 Tax=Micromonospora sp. NPDC050397 TaxID=3364279 RepID=UPI00384E01A2